MIKICDKDIRVDGRLLRIARLDGDKYTFPEDVKLIIDGLQTCGKRIDLFTFLQKLPDASLKYPYPAEWDNLAVIPISTFDHWWTQQIGFKARNKAKQAQKKGVTLRETPFDETLLKGICGIYNECPVRQNKRFLHYGMDLQGARQYAGTFLERSVFIGAFFENEMIGFAKLVFDETRTQACLVHILSMVQHKDKAPTNALIARAVQSCAERKIPYLLYDNFSYGNKGEDSLSDFKERNGFQKFDVPRYYVPLTRTGWTGYRLGLHRLKLIDLIPERVLTRLREFRKAWYKLRPLAES